MWEGSGGLVVMRVLVCLCLSSLSRSCLVYVCCAFSGCREGSCAHVFPHFHPPLSPPLSLFSLSSSPTSYSSSTSLHPFVTSILHCQIFVCLHPLSQASSVACSGSTDGSRAGSVVFFWYLIFNTWACVLCHPHCPGPSRPHFTRYYIRLAVLCWVSLTRSEAHSLCIVRAESADFGFMIH